MATFALKEKQRKFLEFVKDLDEVKERGGVYGNTGIYIIGINTIENILKKGTYVSGVDLSLNKVRELYKDLYYEQKN